MVELVILQGCSTIQLTRGRNTLIDTRDYERLARNKWQAHPMDTSYLAYYAMRTPRDGHGKKLRTRMHRAVLEANVGPCPAGMLCRHLNGDSLDNRSENLKWGTRSQNAKDTIRHGTSKNIFRAGEPNPNTRGERNRSERLKTSDIPEIRRRVAAGETQMSIARSLGVTHTAIWKIVEGRSWRHVGGDPVEHHERTQISA